MDRTIPYLTDIIIPKAINKGKSVLVSSSENAIRGLLMHLCDIPEDEISGIEIPTGLPMVYDVKQKCIKLLEDPFHPDRAYDFGPNGGVIFKPWVLVWITHEIKQYAFDSSLCFFEPI